MLLATRGAGRKKTVEKFHQIVLFTNIWNRLKFMQESFVNIPRANWTISDWEQQPDDIYECYEVKLNIWFEVRDILASCLLQATSQDHASDVMQWKQVRITSETESDVIRWKTRQDYVNKCTTTVWLESTWGALKEERNRQHKLPRL